MTAGPYAWREGCYCGSCEMGRALGAEHKVVPAPVAPAAWEIE